MISTTPSIEGNAIGSAIKELKALDKNLVKEMRKELRAKISPFAKQIADAVPVEAPLSGFGDGDFGHAGDTGWARVRAAISFTPGKSRKTGNHLVSVRIISRTDKRGPYIAEMAGMRSAGKTAQGRALVSNLNKKREMKKSGGRYAFAQFRFLRPDIVVLATTIVNQLIGKVNRRIEI